MPKKPRGLGQSPINIVAYFKLEKFRFTVNQHKRITNAYKALFEPFEIYVYHILNTSKRFFTSFRMIGSEGFRVTIMYLFM